MASPILLDREFLNTLEQVALLCRNDLGSGLGADHRSRNRGAGLEFADYRGYSSGEDSRFLDWNAYLRLGKLFLKVYEAEQNIRVYLLIDRSASMNCEESVESKLMYAQRLAATFAYLALLRLDTTVLLPFADTLETPVIVSGGRNQFWAVLQHLSTLSAQGGTDIYRAVRAFVDQFTSRGMVIVLSDFFDEAGSQRAIEMLHSAHHDFVFVQVHTAEEQRPTLFGDLTLQDVETGEQKVLEFSPESAALYEKEFLEAASRLQRLCVRHGGRYARAVTSIAYQQFVLRSLQSSRIVE